MGLDHPHLGQVLVAHGHGLNMKIVLAVTSEPGRTPHHSMVESICLRALDLARRQGGSTIAISSMGVPTKETGRHTARAIKAWLEGEREAHRGHARRGLMRPLARK